MGDFINSESRILLLEDLGSKFPTKKSNYKKRYGLFRCFCGVDFEARMQDITNGKQKSCGCLRIKHNLRGHRLYNTWKNMMKRCYDPKNTKYVDYGGRGIQVCSEWHDISNFINEMFPTYSEGLSLDRENNDLGYSKDNCRWVTQNIQARNTREIHKTNTSGYRGVSFHKRVNKWVASITINSKQKHLGCFDTPIEAAKAYETFIRQNELEHNFTSILTESEINNLII